ncbi:MAG: secondary thiamine-phosphate synthase enzyme YjbQ [Thermodesulfobacteriota bacterium]
MVAGEIGVKTSGRMEFVDVTAELARAVQAAGAGDGVLYVYNPHTTAGVTINEGADPAVRQDILAVFREIIPARFPYRHAEGNSPAHVMASLVGSSAVVFVSGGRLELGTWQKVFFCEFDGPRQRKLRWRLC